MKIKDIMTTEVGFCTPQDNLAEAVRVMWEKDCGSVPVVADGKVVGIITDRDICVAVATTNMPASTVPVQAVISDTVYTCSPEDGIDTALAIIQAHKVRRLPVVNENGALLGIVSLNDFVRHAGKSTSSKNKTVAQKDVIETLKAVSANA